MILMSKRLKNYTQALKMTNELLLSFPNEELKRELGKGYDFNAMNKTELEQYSSIHGKPSEY